MEYIHLTALLSILIFVLCYNRITGQEIRLPACTIWLLLGGALLVRLVFAYFYHGFSSDISCFSAWANRIFQVGPGEFYSPDVFTDYPPGYMYILYIIGGLSTLFEIPLYSGIHLVLLKLPAILCDLVCGYLLFRQASKRCTNTTAVFLSAAYVLNPAIILNSSLWGQVDSVFTLMVVLLCIFLMENRMLPAYIAFGIGILLKPQTLVFTPMLLAGILDHVFLESFSFEKLWRNLINGMCVIVGMVILSLPFGLDKVLSQYTSTLGSYAYTAVNAYNFWGGLGLNYVSQDNAFFFLRYRDWGTLVILFIVVITFLISLIRKKDPSKYSLLGAFIILTMFVFSVRMHERYMYPGLALLLLAFLCRPAKPLYLCYGLFSVLHLYNTAHVLFFYDPQNYDRRAPIIVLVSGGIVLAIAYFYSYVIRHCKGQPVPTITWSSALPDSALPKASMGMAPEASRKSPPLSRLDLILMLAVTALYSCFALYDLGDRKAPTTTYDMVSGESIVLDFGEDNSPAILSYYFAPWHDRLFTVEKSADRWFWESCPDITLSSVFTWRDYMLNMSSSRYLRLTLTDTSASLIEFTFTDAQGNVIVPLNAADYPTLFDEADLHPARSSFRNSMYFDEIYHARTAYEFLNGLPTYETTHPPLGKIFIALGVAVFGMNPFGWRIIGTLFGILMLPVLYLFAKKLTGNTAASTLASALFAFDFMHFAQTRIATIDVYITFFVIVMYYFMYCYSRMSFYDTPLRKTLLPLGLCGISMGLGVATKWTGVYAGVGLAILFFATLFKRYQEYVYAGKHPKGSTAGISHQQILKSFLPYTKKTILFCVGFFVLIPAVIYLLSYLPFVSNNQTGLLARMLANQESMLSYHSDLVSTHPFSSPWYQWPTMVRPIWYYSGIVSSTLREGISAFGNPLVWWVGIPAALYMCYLALKKKDRTAAFLLVSYLVQYLPWFFVTRITFIYHYFPSVAFVVLMLVHALMQAKNKLSRRTFLLCTALYGIAAFGLFLLFYPVLSGQPVEASYVDTFLRWFDTWILTEI